MKKGILKAVILVSVLALATSLSFSQVEAAKIKLIYWDNAVADEEWVADFEREFIEGYQKANPDIELVFDRFTGSLTDYETKIVVNLRAGKGPDILGNHDVAFDQYVKAGWLVPAEEHNPEFAEYTRKEALTPSILGGSEYGGKIYAACVRGNWLILYYNKDMYKEAGLDPDTPPATFDDLVEYGKKLTKYDDKGAVTRAGFWIRKTGHPQGIFAKWKVAFYSYGGKEYDETFTKSLINSEAGQKALQLYYDVLNTWKLDSVELDPGDQQGFGQKTVAMWWRGDWIKRWLSDYAPDMVPGVNYGAAHIPKAVISSTIASNHPAIGVTKDSKHPKESFDFLLWLMQPEQQLKYARMARRPPTVKSAAAMPEFMEDPIFSVYLTQPNVVWVPELPRLYEMENIMGKNVEAACYGKIGIEEALDQAAKEIEDILKEIPADMKPEGYEIPWW